MNMILGVFYTEIWLNLKKVWKTSKKVRILVSFPHFCRFFNSSWILAQNTTKFISIEVFHFIWHPTHPSIWLGSVWKELKTFLAVCLLWQKNFLSPIFTKLEVWNSYLMQNPSAISISYFNFCQNGRQKFFWHSPFRLSKKFEKLPYLLRI